MFGGFLEEKPNFMAEIKTHKYPLLKLKIMAKYLNLITLTNF